MDQQDLRQWENQCIQEELPECTAACPLHIDVRAFINHITQGNWAESLKTLRITMPLANILGRICDAPCEQRCKRQEAGDAIRIGALERACVRRHAVPQRTSRLPAKGTRIAVIGSGLSSLTVAWDSIRKGYGVRILEPGKALAEILIERYPEELTREVVEVEKTLLMGLGIEIELEAPVDEPGFPDRFLGGFGAVYLGLDGISVDSWDLEREADSTIRIEPSVYSTSRQGVFAGGLTHDGPASPVWQAAEGRFAATSIDRYLQQVSLTAGREKEGPQSTRLYTSLAEKIPEMAVEAVDPIRGYIDDEAIREARRCLQCQCLECVKVCVYLERFGAYPRKYVREIYNNESIVLGSRQSNKLINSCSLCGLCEKVCPEDFAMQDLCLQARQNMVRRGKMPPPAHEFALQDMAFALSDRFLLARHGPGESASRHAFFPGCQLCASDPDKVPAVYGYLQSVLSGGVGLVLGCCAAPAHWAGREEQFARELEGLKGQWRSLGEPKLILACSTCLRMFKEHLPEMPLVSLWQVLDEIGGPPAPSTGDPMEPFAIHDPCTTRSEPGIQSSVRLVLGRLGVPIEELRLGRGETECCGFGGLQQNANPELSCEVARRRGQRSPRDYLTYCAMCRDSLASADKRALHLLDLLFPDPRVSDPAARLRPGWSERQENRAHLKERLLKELWSEETVEKEEHQRIKLHVGPEVQVLLEKRRILEEDLQRVIHHAETTNEKFHNPKTGRFKAAFRPHNVTFWVEYSPTAGGFVVDDAYCHRMELTVS